MARNRTPFLVAGALAILLLVGSGWLIIPRLTRGSLVVDARIAYKPGESRPLLNETFYLLDADMILLSMVEGNEAGPLREKVYREHPNLGMVARVMDARRRNAYSLGAEVIQFMEDSRPLWETHVVQSARTDGQGRIVFKNLKPGDYWLMGRTKTNEGAAFWNQRVSIDRGRNEIMLDQDNALYAK
jgi:hypothetical protein